MCRNTSLLVVLCNTSLCVRLNGIRTILLYYMPFRLNALVTLWVLYCCHLTAKFILSLPGFWWLSYECMCRGWQHTVVVDIRVLFYDKYIYIWYVYIYMCVFVFAREYRYIYIHISFNENNKAPHMRYFNEYTIYIQTYGSRGFLFNGSDVYNCLI